MGQGLLRLNKGGDTSSSEDMNPHLPALNLYFIVRDELQNLQFIFSL